MEALYNREIYGESTALRIEGMGSTVVSIANRWTLGWPSRVLSLLVSRQYLNKLIAQADLETDVLANETSLTHLSSREILEMHGVAELPPEATNASPRL